ncbi:DUF4184 family protein [Ginsengibacter hankyongi]|uniref:DUF4184 family protein n=1 Tax=Ginsengibacter hankyongi TaxID=2607284 RepID=A0A5J5IMG4_9BACT|nr:DUF4184 family protein [Ginsengibacter hankyongi]KAA9041074.1 DUF4184 family protein [Ginsengibacter hankyongi]
MPFTFSHPAIVLPATSLPKKYYSLSSLIIGSMTPDFEYFIRMKDYSRYSHTWSGVFWFDVPLGLILLFIFHNVVRNTLIEYLPFSYNVRLSTFEKFNWNQYFKKNTIVVFISLLAGISSHLFWDSFTHDGGFFAETIPVLNDNINILNHNISGALLFQYISSLIGAIAILIFILKFPEGHKTKQPNILTFWLVVSSIMMFILAIRLYLDSLLNHHDHEDIIVTMISGALIGILSLSVFINENKKRQLYKKLNRVRNK